MDGGFSVLQAANSNGWGNYIVGTAENGALQYGLRFNNTGMLSKVAWIKQEANATTPDAQAPTVFWNQQTGIAYAAYVTNTTSTSGTVTSTFNLTEVDNGATTSKALPFVATSALTAGGGNIYLGDSQGNVWSMPEAYGSASNMVSSLMEIGSTRPVTVSGSSVTQPIGYVGYTQEGGLPYVWATSTNQITTFVFTSTGWSPNWNSFDGGAGSWLNGTYTSNTVGPNPSASGVQWLAANATINANSLFVDGTLVVPVYTPVSTTASACGVGSGYYDLFNLNNGYFPGGVFMNANGQAITGNIWVGMGHPYAAQVSTLSNGGLMLYGSSQQNSTGGISVQASAVAKQNVGSSIVAWRNYLMR
jgi:hypothetical protein